MRAWVRLIAIAINLTVKNDFKVLMWREDGRWLLPETIYISNKLITHAAELLSQHLKLEARIEDKGWIELYQLPVVEEKNDLVIPYGCMVPFDVPPVNVHTSWVALSDLLNLYRKEVSDTDLQIIIKAAQLI